MRQLCECGCGRKVTKEGNRFIHGHYWRGKTHSTETKAKQRIAHLGKTLSEEHRSNMTYNLEKWEEKCPLLLKVEEIKEEDGKILVHCINHNCPNSKEMDGWFIPTGCQLEERTRALNGGNDHNCFYCSDQCKRTCSKYDKKVSQLIKEDEIAAGIRPEPIYDLKEYNTWKKEVLRRQKEDLGYNECEYCGNRNINELIVHHEKPQKTHPLLALDPDNGIIACGANSKNKCHYHYGHRTGTECSTGNLANKICI